MYPNMSQEIARHRYADTLRDARAAQHRAWLAAEREPVDRLEPLRSVVGRLGERLHVRHRSVRPATRPVC
jgi:hypothetical protein